ncbi:MAG TPA: cell division protein FtsH, partial [Solirubrobacteraceae bacterium]|nr:cell division protein FtsH [Solirubrobacteraceae bacterium]
IAPHEAGHAIVSAAAPGADAVHKVSIVSRGQAGGLTWFTPQEELHFASRSQLMDRLAVLLAGRAADELFSGEPSSGARDDLKRATRLARAMVSELGMAEAFGPVSLDGDGADPFDAVISQALASEAHGEVKRIMADALERARGLLREHREPWEALAQKLLEQESLEDPELSLMLEDVRSRAASPTPGSVSSSRD